MHRISAFYANVKQGIRESGLPLAVVLQRLCDTGISALDVDYCEIKQGLPPEIAQTGFVVNSIYAFLNFTAEGSMEEAKRAVDAAAQYNAAMMFVPEKLNDEQAASLKECTDATDVAHCLSQNEIAVCTAKSLEALALYGRTKGVSVCVENFDSRRSLTERKAELLWLFGQAPHLMFNPDTGNSATCGEDIAELFTIFRDRVVNIHCKDRIRTEKGYKCITGGEGDMPIRELCTQLLDSGYTGAFSVEVFGVPNILDSICRSALYLGTIA